MEFLPHCHHWVERRVPVPLFNQDEPEVPSDLYLIIIIRKAVNSSILWIFLGFKFAGIPCLAGVSSSIDLLWLVRSRKEVKVAMKAAF